MYLRILFNKAHRLAWILSIKTKASSSIADTRALVSLSLEMHDKKSSEKLFLLSGDAAQQYPL
jgi:hypothetical protein